MHRMLLLLLATMGSFQPAAAAPQALADVPLLTDLVQPTVMATIDGRADVRCIVDTGSSMGVLQSELTTRAEPAGVANVRVANGKIAMHIVSIRTMSIGAAKATEIEFYRRDQSWFNQDEPLPCVIGVNFMKHFTIDMDGRAARLRLYPRGTRIDDILGAPAPVGAHLQTRILQDGLIQMDAFVDGIAVQSQLDTGWGFATPNRILLDKLGIAPGDPRIVEQTYTNKISGKPHVLQTVELRGIRIGNLELNTARASISEQNMRVISAQSGPYLHIGWGTLHEHRLLLDLTHADVALIP